jgi:hypothetical protein
MTDTLDYILSKFDLVDMANKAGTTMKRCQSDWRGPCPLHHGHDPNSFAIYNEDGKQKFKCFSSTCGSGDVIDFYAAWHGVDIKTAIRELGGDTKPDPTAITQAAIARAERAEKQLQDTIALAQKALADLREARTWEKYHAMLDGCEDARNLWASRGIPQVWQDLWRLGYCDSFRVNTASGGLVTPTLAMPIFGKGWDLLNIRHRLINPINPKDKYRPDRPGLPAQPFMTDPDLGMDANNILIVEGEIKSMVTYITLDSSKWQVLGIPGKSWFHKIAGQMNGKRVVVCFDPDANAEAEQAAKDTGGKMIRLEVKIDDAINAGELDREGLRDLIRCATKP